MWRVILKSVLKSFWKNESGAVTVDWVVLTAAIVGIAIAVLTVIAGGVNNASNDIDDRLVSAATGSVASLISANGTALTMQDITDGNPGGNYSYAGVVDNGTGAPVYFNPNTDTVSVDGTEIPTGDYVGSGGTDGTGYTEYYPEA